jgi:TonB-dependent starch-binding outer membrane protein SusC
MTPHQTLVRDPRRKKSRRWQEGVRVLLALSLMSLVPADAEAQERGQITGQAVDAQSGAPVAEVQVYIAGTDLGSLTRSNGRFVILNVPVGTYDLRAERIGYGTATQSVTVTAGGTAEVTFQLTTQALGLDEIVVTGTAGASRRREIGNSISQINVAEVRERPSSVTNLLQGAAPGIEITGGDGQAGQGKQIRLRGNNSVSMTNQPIIYIDGVRMMDGAFPAVTTPGMTQGRGAFVTASPLDNINPNDIDRVEIIKGSAATTLYGTEASAGVIQIFTKRGSSGAPVWTAEVQQGTGWAKKYGANGVNYMHMEHFLRDPWWGGGYEGGDMSLPCVTDDPRWKGTNTNPEGACSWPGAQWYQTYNLSVRGGGNALQYYLSGQFQDDSGMLPLDELEKYNFQGNFTMSPLQDLQVMWNTGFSRQWQQNTPSGNNLSGVELQIMRQERNYFSDGDPRVVAQALGYDFQQWIERLTTGVTLSYSPIADLTNRFTAGYDYAQQEARNLMNFGYWEFPDGSLVSDVFQKRLLTFDYVGSYRFTLAEGLRSNFSWGGQAIGNDLRQITAVGQNFPGASQPTIRSAAIQRADERREKVWNAGFFFQNVFDIADRYFLTAGLRVDGNSAFGQGFGLQSYPKVSATWIMSDEAFWPQDLGTLKLRTAYGQSGRAPGTFDAVRTWRPVGFLGEPAFRPDNRGNPDLGPEVTSEFEVGFDASWMQDRVTVTFTYFDQVTRDALMNVSSIPSLGFSGAQLENVGKLGNKGIEIQTNANIFETAVWGLQAGLGISTNHSKVLDLGGNPEFSALGGRIIEGEPAPVAWSRRVANRDEIAPYVYENDGENVVIGPLYPTHFVTPSLSLRVPGNVLLSARGEYRGGHVRNMNPIPVGRSVRSPLCFPYYVDPANDITLKADIPAIWRERCTPRGGSDYWFDGDYFKLRAVSATVPVDFIFPDRVSNAAFTLSLANAYDWYREIPWWDPEILGNTAATSEAVASSTERTPAPAILRLSLRVSF